jgi:hypothetical protein
VASDDETGSALPRRRKAACGHRWRRLILPCRDAVWPVEDRRLSSAECRGRFTGVAARVWSRRGRRKARCALGAADEVMALCAVLRRYNAAYFTHIRDESNKVMDAVEEAIDIALACGVHVEIVHLSVTVNIAPPRLMHAPTTRSNTLRKMLRSRKRSFRARENAE